MASTFQDSDDALLAWAMPVSLPKLGARLEAYAATKVIVTTLRLTARDTPLNGFRNLPEEILQMVVRQIRNDAFQGEMKKWVKMRKCLAHVCHPLSHADPTLLADLGLDSMQHMDDEEIIDVLDDEGQLTEAHQDDLAAYYHKLTNLEGKSKFAKCVKIFAEDFGLRPHFLLHKVFDPDYGDPYNLDCIEAEAYLTYEIAKFPHKANPGPEVSSYFFKFSMDPAVLVKVSQAFTDTHEQLFKTAANVLDIRAFDPEEDESMYEENYVRPPLSPCPCGCEGPTDLEFDSDADYDSDGLCNNCGDPACSLSMNGNMLPPNAVPKPDAPTSSATPPNPQASSNSDPATSAHVLAGPASAINAEIGSEPPTSANAKPQEQQVEDTETAKLEPKRQETWPKMMILGCGNASCYAAD